MTKFLDRMRFGNRNGTLQSCVVESARDSSLDFYLSALLAPGGARDDLFVLSAFRGEIERIGIISREPLVGEIRLQWWRDRLDGEDAGADSNEDAHGDVGGLSGNPIADALVAAVARHDLDRSLLFKMIDAQSGHLYGQPVGRFDEFFTNAAEFDGSFFKLSVQVLGADASGDVCEVADAGGRAFGTARVLTRLRAFAQRGYWPLPPGTAFQAGQTSADFVVDRGLAAERRLSVERAITLARIELDRAAERYSCLSLGVKPAFLPLALVEPYFKAFERRRGDPLLMRLDLSALDRRMKLWLVKTRGVI